MKSKKIIILFFFFLISVIVAFGGFIMYQHSETKKLIKAIDNKDYETIESISQKILI